jgi:hypothetical protein
VLEVTYAYIYYTYALVLQVVSLNNELMDARAETMAAEDAANQ